MGLLTWSVLVAAVFHANIGPLTSTITKAPPTPDTQDPIDCAQVASRYSIGDAKLCQDFMQANGFGVKHDLGVIPGHGWDNIMNEEKGLVVSQAYKHCKLTDDSQMLIPDNVFSTPLKYCRQETLTEIFDSWLETTSTTSKSINTEVSAEAVFGNKISASFSAEKAEMRSEMMRTGGMAVRTQIRVDKYDVFLKPDCDFSPEFESRLKSIATNIQLNYNQMAEYEAQMLVRDFGTHVVTRLKAGATLIATGFVQRSYMKKMTEEESTQKVAAAASVGFGLYSGSKQKETKEKKQNIEEFQKSVIHSTVEARGGDQNIVADFGRVNITQWIRGMDQNLVPIDRAGEPIYHLITTRALPMIPAPIVRKVANVVQAAVAAYYKENAISGCTDINSPSFNPFANVDDKNCDEEIKKMKWGGIFIKSTCTPTPTNNEYKELMKCHVDNIIVDKLSCPAHYKEVHLLTYEINDPKYCSSRCTNELFWCVRFEPLIFGLPVYYGGIYSISKNTTNHVTGNYGCPLQFRAQYLTEHYKICLTHIKEDAEGNAVPFGGFQSCNAANTMADENSKFGCPHGYLPNVIENDDNCLMHYCVQQKAVPGRAFVKIPPFVDQPEEIVISNYQWARADYGDVSPNVSIAMVAGMVFLSVFFVILIFIALVFCISKRPNQKIEIVELDDN